MEHPTSKRHNDVIYTFNKDEQVVLTSIIQSPYMKKAVELIEEFVRQTKSLKVGYKKVFAEIYTILRSAQSSVESYLAHNKKKGEITTKNYTQLTIPQF